MWSSLHTQTDARYSDSQVHYYSQARIKIPNNTLEKGTQIHSWGTTSVWQQWQAPFQSQCQDRSDCNGPSGYRPIIIANDSRKDSNSAEQRPGEYEFLRPDGPDQELTVRKVAVLLIRVIHYPGRLCKTSNPLSDVQFGELPSKASKIYFNQSPDV